MQLRNLIDQVAGFDSAAPREKIKILGWWLHTHGGKELFGAPEIRGCYGKLHVDEPPALATYLTRMAEGKDLLKEKGQYKLARAIRADLDKRYGVDHSVIAVNKILTDLPEKVPNVTERAFLSEALKYYRIEAYRSCIAMTWNLAYAHLLDWILNDTNRLAAFNTAIIKRYPKKAGFSISKYDEFLDELKEREVLEICSTGGLFNSNIFKILKEKLDRRNMVAHPSTTVVVQSQADDVVTDLVNNVVLTLR
jgi:hypothetical protein